MPSLVDAINQGPAGLFSLVWWFFTQSFGWVILFIGFDVMIVWMYLLWIRNMARKHKNYILLAVDVPLENEQNPKAIENLFQHFTGAHQTFGIYDKWWSGEVHDSFSLEIVSIGGYIQFVIYTRDIYRDLIESVFYAQYPDARITEIEDYTKKWNIRFPSDQYDMWGTEIVMKKPQYYPIKTFEDFIDKASNEFKDPMASMLEGLSKIGPGEEIWIQLVITPADNDWGEDAESLIQKLIGGKAHSKSSFLDILIFKPIQFLSSIISEGLNPAAATSTSKRGDDAPNKILYLTPGQTDTVAAIERKIGKLGFHTRIRTVYVAPKQSFKRKLGLKVIYGSFKQFNSLSLNALKLNSRTYPGGLVWFADWRENWRRNLIFSEFKDRGHSLNPGEYGKIMSSEELASIYHFPVKEVKAPQLKTIESRRAEPPIELPTSIFAETQASPAEKSASTEEMAQPEDAGPPENLPVV
ncbi:MAG: hypothetical protein COT81_02215 [Candidatus Buchananbacteria bacterium CG10_big_fil_rev_8_21_14_0_10_42_9]|uniref:DUF8128 domain-containing protein n=1 Tax=Candidatus Buchananbacteria bacterium CG10_big_fil_rev_8_21_14_0_10_42_9 TaxID=1974526 RepID=A0A2H0W1H9_9BACT|nr:MAG: hypothetical protein COT81_02215 [Candidatus Buchananbacteria bacterium CG10_big_fil_rev_8_21_14_0_10_42_9]